MTVLTSGSVPPNLHNHPNPSQPPQPRRAGWLEGWVRTCSSPVGPLRLQVDPTGSALVRVVFEASPRLDPSAPPDPAQRLLDETEARLTAYFAGDLRDFALPLEPIGTEFQRLVWKTLATIPYGETWSYAELAARIGRPRACRAVGAANRRNPLALVLPCHRVIGSNGALVGYAGGLDRKAWLLDHERAVLKQATVKR